MTKRADKKKNIDKVASSLIKNPLQTEREVAKDTWIGKSTVNRAKEELGQIGAKDKRIVTLTNNDFSCIELWVEEIKKRLWNVEELEKMRTIEIAQVIKENTARYTLFRWEVTDDKWWLKSSKEIDNTPLEDLVNLVQEQLNK